MSDKPDQPMLASAQVASLRSSGWLWYLALPGLIALVTYFVALHKLHNPSDGPLNVLNGLIAAIFATGAFVSTMVSVRTLRGPGRR